MSVYRHITGGAGGVRESNKLNCSYLSETHKSEHRHINKWFNSQKDHAPVMPFDIAGSSTSKISERGGGGGSTVQGCSTTWYGIVGRRIENGPDFL